jgi:aminomethyltransferase
MPSASVPRAWDPGPRFELGLRSPLVTDEWAWRTLRPDHPALLGRPNVLRRNDPGDAFRVIADKYGQPNSYCVLGGNVASVSNWEGITFTEQYQAVTRGAGVFPCGGMYYLSVVGPHAADVLNLLTPKRIDSLEIGQAAFAIFTTPEGTVDTEGVVLRDGEQSFQVSVGGDACPPTWLHDAIDAYPDTRAQETNLSSFNIKGPDRMAAMAELLRDEYVPGLATLRAFRGMPVRTRLGGDAWVVRTVIGVELWAADEVIHQTWRAMVADPGRYTPCGWDLLATFRLECREFTFYLCPLDIHRGTYLFDVGLGHMVSRRKAGPYVGAEALANPARWGGRMWIGGLTAHSPEAPERQIGEHIFHAGSDQPGGYVTSAGSSPREGRQLCFAHLAFGIRPGETVRFADGTTWRVLTLPMASAVPASLTPGRRPDGPYPPHDATRM